MILSVGYRDHTVFCIIDSTKKCCAFNAQPLNVYQANRLYFVNNYATNIEKQYKTKIQRKARLQVLFPALCLYN